MATSSDFGKFYISLMIGKLAEAGKIASVLDCGCGSGTYKTLLGSILPGATWTGIDAWEPYVSQFELEKLYDRIIVSDLRQVAYSSLPPADLVIFGDVLEHMTQAEAIDVVSQARAIASYVLISIPVVDYPQGEVHGNPYEVHIKEDWNHYQVMGSFAGVSAFFIHDHIGVYFLTSTAQAASDIDTLQAVVAPIQRRKWPNHRMAWGRWVIENHLE